MCSRCPSVAWNININLGHIRILVLFDYAVVAVMILANFTEREAEVVSATQGGKKRIFFFFFSFFFFGGIFLVFVVQISGTDRCLSHAHAAIYPLLLPVFIIFFGWVSLWRQGSEQPDSPPWKHLQLENRAAPFVC